MNQAACDTKAENGHDPDAPAAGVHTENDATSTTTDRRQVKRVLMLTHRLPYPPDRGDRIRSYNLLKLLSEHFEVGIACTSEESVWLQHHQLLSTIAERVVIQPISATYSKAKSALALAGGGAVTRNYYYRVGLAETIRQWHEQAPFDAVLTFCTGMIHYSRLLVPPPAGVNGKSNGHAANEAPPRHVLDLVDVDSIKWGEYAKHSWPPKRWAYAAEARRLRRIEAGRYDHFDAVTVVSEAEAEAYNSHVGGHPCVVPVGNGVDLEYFAPLEDVDSKTLAFVGVLNYRPNVDGLVWFTRNVFGMLRKRVPDAKLLIVGRHPNQRVKDLGEHPGVQVVGSVPDVRTYLEQASAVITPLQIARGVQNKVLEAMASARVVVGSTAASQGIDAVDGEHLFVADTPGQWVDTIERIFTDSPLRQRVAAAARQRVETGYSWNQCLMPMVQLLKGEHPAMLNR